MLKFSHYLYLPLYHMDSPTYKGHNDLTCPHLHLTFRKQSIYLQIIFYIFITFPKINLGVTSFRDLTNISKHELTTAMHRLGIVNTVVC